MTSGMRADLCVIGGGSAGLSVAAGAVQMGASVVLVEAGRMGGDCLNYGCVPSKSLIAAAGHAHAMTAGAAFGIAPVAPKVDFGAVGDHLRAVIEGIAPHDSVERFEALGVRVIRGHGRFVSPTELAVEDSLVTARRFVIATGSRPHVPPIAGLGSVRYFTNEDIFELRERPEHLVILGGGPVGMELAQAYRRLGSRVTVLERLRALGGEDPDLAAVVLERVGGEGVDVVQGAQAESVEPVPNGIAVRTRDGARVTGSHLLVAAGRRSSVEDLGLEVAGIAVTEDGIAVDAGLRTSNRRVYAIGDVTGGMRFTHVAGYHASVVLRSALFGLPSRAATGHIPRVVYTDPELAQVGPVEEEARRVHGARLEVLRWSYAENDRARSERLTEGLIKVMVVGGRPVGAGIVGAQAGELIGLWSLAISSRLKIGQVAGMVAPYPTLTEISKRAAGQYYVPRLFGSDRVKQLVRLIQKFA